MKQEYEAPQVQVIEMEVQSMLAQSPGFGAPDTVPDGGTW